MNPVSYYKILSTGETYALDKSTGKANKIQSVPQGERALSWAGAGLPPDLQGAAADGAGGPGDPAMTQQTGGTPYFMGPTALVKIIGTQPGDETYWQVDTATKTVRPFENLKALQQVYQSNLPAAMNAVQTLHSGDFGRGGVLSDYQMLGGAYVIKPGELPKQIDASNSQLQARYGKPIDTQVEQSAITAVGGFLNSLQKENSGIASGFINSVKNDPSKIAYYINALAYGGYTMSDIYRDVKNKELISQGNTAAANTQPISASQTRDMYQNTEQGRSAYTNQQITPPTQIGGIDPNAMNLAIYDIPAEAYKTLVPQLNPKSPEFKAMMDQVNTAYIDILTKQVEANTESEKAAADYAWGKFKSDTERLLGVSLSNNAIDAWKQIESANEQFAQQGIQQSGITSEKIDDYLRGVRRSDQQNRASTLSSEEAKQSEYYQKFATPTQIAALSDADKQKYGLLPSAEIKNALSFSTLKQKYPDMSDEEINTYIASVLDEGGNYRSNLYQKKLSDTQKLDADKKTYQQQMVELDALNKENKAYSEFSKSESPFLRQTEASGKQSATESTSNTTDVAKATPTGETATLDANGKAFDDPSYKFRTDTGAANVNYRIPAEVPKNVGATTTKNVSSSSSTPVSKPNAPTYGPTIPEWSKTLSTVLAASKPVTTAIKTPSAPVSVASKIITPPKAPILSSPVKAPVVAPKKSLTGYDWNSIGSTVPSSVKSIFGSIFK